MSDHEAEVIRRLEKVEDRQDRFEEVVLEIRSGLSDINTKLAVLTAESKVKLDAGRSPSCILHQQQISEIFSQIEKNRENVESLKARIWYFSGIAVAIGYFADKLFFKK